MNLHVDVYTCVTWFSWQPPVRHHPGKTSCCISHIWRLSHCCDLPVSWAHTASCCSFRKADLYPTTWLLHTPHNSVYSTQTCMFSGRLFFTWHLVLNIIKDNSVLPPRAFNLLVPDLLPCHVLASLEEQNERVCSVRVEGKFRFLVAFIRLQKSL